MAVLGPVPTYANPTIVDQKTGEFTFNPIWLKWFIDLAKVLNAAGGISGLEHNLLAGLQGGAANQYYHLSQTDFNAIIHILYTRDIGLGDAVSVSESVTISLGQIVMNLSDSTTVTESVALSLV